MENVDYICTVVAAYRSTPWQSLTWHWISNKTHLLFLSRPRYRDTNFPCFASPISADQHQWQSQIFINVQSIFSKIQVCSGSKNPSILKSDVCFLCQFLHLKNFIFFFIFVLIRSIIFTSMSTGRLIWSGKRFTVLEQRICGMDKYL